ncbi:hypothetical protein [Heyndrickxia acidicola]|uniref:Uncharacterized protein n=1 Tax=Heyndrickxia acidicola TaxID=209389 RepID=A0ABU6MA18_9BACI|nr:hypothetical protein [Heyndrickxia acidicola]MED1201518.1 hypothetical protein [Heyndrickxia acidicola]
MMIIVMFVIFAIIVIAVMSIINIRYSSQNAERKKLADNKHKEVEEEVLQSPETADESDVTSRVEKNRSAAHTESLQEIPVDQLDQKEAEHEPAPQTRSEKHAGKVTMDNINDQAYREALVKFKYGHPQEEEKPVKKNMNDDAFRKALQSLSKKDDDHS